MFILSVRIPRGIKSTRFCCTTTICNRYKSFLTHLLASSIWVG